ncbi:hypothetical protein JCM16303_006308 [Sporobolomyces ruberrimus]
MGIGPEIPPHLLGPAAAGPSLPPPVPPTTAKREEVTSDSDSDYAPDLPPDFVKPPPSNPIPSTSSSKPIAGPQLPPHLLSRSSQPPSRPASDSEEEEDYGPGPLPPPAGTSLSSSYDTNDGARAFLEREEREREKERKEKEARENKKMVREEWMLVPPKEMNLMSSMDPTKLKSRSFQSGPKAQKSTRQGGMNDGPNLWTETPAERQQRLEDEALGKKRKAENSVPQEEEDDEETRRKKSRDRRLKEEVERHNRTGRNQTLLEKHEREKKKGKGRDGKDKDKEEPTGWDRDRDMSVGGRMIDDGKRKQMIKDAKGLGGRFGSSGFM